MYIVCCCIDVSFCHSFFCVSITARRFHNFVIQMHIARIFSIARDRFGREKQNLIENRNEKIEPSPDTECGTI